MKALLLAFWRNVKGVMNSQARFVIATRTVQPARCRARRISAAL